MDVRAVGKLSAVFVDANDVEMVAEFWGPFESIHRWVVLTDPEGTEFCAVTTAPGADR